MSKKNSTTKNTATEENNTLRFSVAYNIETLEKNASDANTRVELIRESNKGSIKAAVQRAIALHDVELGKRELNTAYEFTTEEKKGFKKAVEEFTPSFLDFALIKGTWSPSISAARYQRLADKLKLINNAELLEGQVAAALLKPVPPAEEKVEVFKVLYPELLCESADVKRVVHTNDEPECHLDNVFEYTKERVLAALAENIERRAAFDEALATSNREARLAAINSAGSLAEDAIDSGAGVAAFNKRLEAVASPEAFGDAFQHPHAYRTENLPSCYFEEEQYADQLERLSNATNEKFTMANFNPNLLLPVPEFDGSSAVCHVSRIYRVVVKDTAAH